MFHPPSPPDSVTNTLPHVTERGKLIKFDFVPSSAGRRAHLSFTFLAEVYIVYRPRLKDMTSCGWRLAQADPGLECAGLLSVSVERNTQDHGGLRLAECPYTSPHIVVANLSCLP
ncbi:hypothetical protein PoB_001110500 [Plakobranchus ocellatus]|uniref:MATH domain-containing protein n=1 Tax=Plakobranchus ocellatus TaxID=259542 RepID=A0AAV3YPD9_9GAST|nr:hypothetical protein PoB_001110500 [Plakobranchus ocellatus]